MNITHDRRNRPCSLLVSSDKNGNLTSDQNGTTYDYDAQNRLIRVETKGTNPTVVTMAYDARNRVVSRTINGDETTYVYDGWTLINEYDSYGIEDAHYIHGPAIDEILTHNATLGGAAYYTQDGNGNVTTITSSSGAVQERYTYDVYGTPTITTSTGVIVSSSAVGNRFLFTGREYIAEIGLYDYRNRVYSPGLGRFLQTDPIRFKAGDINIYRYVRNSPMNGVDPRGEWPIGALIGGIAGGISVVANPNFSHLTHCQQAGELALGIGIGAAGGALRPDVAPVLGGLLGLAGDLANQLIENGGNLGGINTGELLGATAAGVLVGSLGGVIGESTQGKIFTGAAGVGATTVISEVGKEARSGGKGDNNETNNGNGAPVIIIRGGPNHPGGY